MSTPINPIPVPPEPGRDPDIDPAGEPDITTPPGDDSPLIERPPEEDPNEQLPRDV